MFLTTEKLNNPLPIVSTPPKFSKPANKARELKRVAHKNFIEIARK